MRLTASVDSATRRLETTLTGRDREVLLDTERPLMIQRNDCQNHGPAVADCVEHVLRTRLSALTAASVSPSSITSEIPRYTFFDLPYVRRWGAELVGKRIAVLGCIILDPDRIPTNRTRGVVSAGCSKVPGATLPVIFTTMSPERALYYDKRPSTYWVGTLERRDGGMVLNGVSP